MLPTVPSSYPPGGVLLLPLLIEIAFTFFFKHKKVLFAMSAQAQKTSCKEAGIEYNMYLHTTHKKQKEVITFFAQFANRGKRKAHHHRKYMAFLLFYVSCKREHVQPSAY